MCEHSFHSSRRACYLRGRLSDASEVPFSDVYHEFAELHQDENEAVVEAEKHTSRDEETRHHASVLSEGEGISVFVVDDWCVVHGTVRACFIEAEHASDNENGDVGKEPERVAIVTDLPNDRKIGCEG